MYKRQNHAKFSQVVIRIYESPKVLQPIPESWAPLSEDTSTTPNDQSTSGSETLSSFAPSLDFRVPGECGFLPGMDSSPGSPEPVGMTMSANVLDDIETLADTADIPLPAGQEKSIQKVEGRPKALEQENRPGCGSLDRGSQGQPQKGSQKPPTEKPEDVEATTGEKRHRPG